MAFICRICDKSFIRRSSCRRHEELNSCQRKLIGGAKKTKKRKETRGRPKTEKKCDICSKEFYSRRNMLRHKKLYHSNYPPSYPCGYCNLFFQSPIKLDYHRTIEHSLNSEIYLSKNAFRDACQIFRLDISPSVISVNEAIQESSKKLLDFFENKTVEFKNMKYSIVLAAEYARSENSVQVDDNNEPERLFMNFRSRTQHLLESSDIASSIARSLLSVENNAESFNANGSNWLLQRIFFMDIEIGKCMQLSGSCSLHVLNQKRDSGDPFGVRQHDEWPVTMDNEEDDGKCFYYSLASYFLDGETNPSKLREYIAENIIEPVESPVKITDISKIEEANKQLDFSVNVIYKNSEDEVYPVYISKKEDTEHVINILLFYIGKVGIKKHNGTNVEMSDHSDDEDLDGTQYDYFNMKHVNMFEDNDEYLRNPLIPHYALIENLNREVTRAREFEAIYRSNKLIKRKHKIIEGIKNEIDTTRQKISKHTNTLNQIKDEKQLNDTLSSLDNLQNHLNKISDYKEKLYNEIRELKNHKYAQKNITQAATRSGRHVQVCCNCFSVFSTQHTLKTHKEWCYKEKPSFVLLPLAGEKMEFELKRKHKYTSIQFFFDFEALQIKPEYNCSCRPELVPNAQNSCSFQNSVCTHGTKISTEHYPFSFCIAVAKNDEEILDLIEYTGMDAIDVFIETLLDLEEKYIAYLGNAKPMQLTPEQEDEFLNEKSCYICKIPYNPDDRPCRDHDHISGEYLGMNLKNII